MTTPKNIMSMIAFPGADAGEIDEVCDIAANWCELNRVEILRVPSGTEIIPQLRRKLAEYGVALEVVGFDA